MELNKIMKIKEEDSFDFREFVNPQDDRSHFFDEWVDYYQLKYAICKAIKPASILEIGVRYGYSAITFLKASPEASYLGIDNDSDTYGGSAGAVRWAKRITEGYNAEFLLTDTQQMMSLPGEFHDLVHVDGQQDGDGTFHDLEMALEKARYILVDGYFHSKENMLSSTYFLEKYRHFIDHSIIIPGYAGELLIKVKPAAKGIFSRRQQGYSHLEDCYDSDYYLGDCGGSEAFKKTKGQELSNPRLKSVYRLANPQPDEKILDIGCGRGELSLSLSKTDCRVTGIDYAKASIEIAQSLATESGDNQQLEFIKADFLTWPCQTKFDKIIAADVVEHIEQEPLEEMFSKVSSLLAEDGIFVVHTSPNKLQYSRAYDQKRKMARNLGCYLPRNSRSYHKDLMHINEQTPSGLNRALKRHFKHVLTWVATLPDISGTLLGKISKSRLLQAETIFAIASNAPINREEVLATISQTELSREGLNAEIFSAHKELVLTAKERFALPVTVHNYSQERFLSLPPYPVHVSYHWVNESGEFAVFNGLRTSIDGPLQPFESREFQVDILAPEKEGDYQLQITLVQERQFWFEKIVPQRLPLNIKATVRSIEIDEP